MTHKATLSGAEWKRFYDDPFIWGPNTYADDLRVIVDGDDSEEIDLKTVADTAVVVVECGELYEAPRGVPCDLIDAIDYWRRRQTSRDYVVNIPHDKLAATTDALLALGIVIQTI